MTLLLAFIFGAALGSFAQVVATRLHVASFVNARSKCLSCSHILSWKDMVPIASCLFLRGKCRYCKVRFGYGSALLELSLGLTVMFLVSKYGLSGTSASLADVKGFLFQLAVVFTLTIIFLYDLSQKIIPKVFLYFFLTLSLFPYLSRIGHVHTMTEIAAPLIVALPYLILFLLTLGRGVGFGDVLLFLGVGAMFGLDKGLLVFLLSLWIGTLTVLPLLALKKLKRKSAVPFAPFIIIAYLVVLFTDYSVSALISFIYHGMI